MKNAIVMTGVGVGLFVATVVGVLGLQGRLNREGVKGLPLLPMLFPAETETGAGESGQPAGRDPQGADKARPADKDKPKGKDKEPLRTGPLGKEPPLPYRLGSPLFEKGGAEAGGHGGEHGEAKTAPAAGNGAGEPGAGEAAAPNEAAKGAAQDPEWSRKVEDVMGQGQYETGSFFEFPRLPAGLTVDAINEIIREARELQRTNQDEKAAIALRKTELDARENDVKDRQDELARKIREVEAMRTDLEDQIKKAQGTVLIVKASEAQRWKENAASLANLEPRKAADVLMEWWKTEERQEWALKTLALMDADARDAIFASLSTSQLREVMERRLKVFVEPQKKEGGR